MKKILSSLLFSGLLSLNAMAQPCEINITGAGVDLISATEVGTNCVIKFNYSFNLEANGGNKRVFMHIWDCDNYPVPALTYQNPPTGTQLASSLGTIIIDNFTDPPTLMATYTPSAGVNVLSAGLTLTIDPVPGQPTFQRYTISGLEFTFPGECSDIACIKADVWGTQSGNASPPVQCTLLGIESVLNNPIVEADFNCNEATSPNTYDVVISNSNLGISLPGVVYKVYRDDGVLVDGFAQYNVDTDIDLLFTSAPSTLDPGETESALNQAFTYTAGNMDRSLWVVLYIPSLDQYIIDEADYACVILPVKFISFDAARAGKMVKLEWKTAQEIGSAGFEVQRIAQNGTVETIGKVGTKAVNGNSNSELSYTFEHMNAASAPYQYRIKQLDINGRIEFTQLRKVNGLNGVQTAYVYPNPAVGGRLKVYFDDASTERMVSLIDNTGRMVKQVTSKNVNQVEIAVSNPGIYHLKVFIPSTGKTMLQKVVVN